MVAASGSVRKVRYWSNEALAMSEPFCHDDRSSYVVALGSEREPL
jgi:hypothetical protein